MEPDIKAFLTIVMQSIFILLLWMLVNTYFGIKLELLFPGDKISFWNILYYILMIASFVWVIRYIVKKWKKMPKFENNGG